MSRKTVIEAVSLSKAYSEQVTALHDINISVQEGEFVSLIGRSGSGKSTLLNIIGGLDSPTSGSVLVNGTPVDYTDQKALIALRRGVIGFVFQDFNLLPTLTALENVSYPLLFDYHQKEEREKRASALLEMVGLSGRKDHYPNHMSGGEQQRVAIARALVGRPLIVLADEPTGNLDSKTSDGIFELMREVNREEGTTFLIVTHEREVGRYSDRTIELLDGRVVA